MQDGILRREANNASLWSWLTGLLTNAQIISLSLCKTVLAEYGYKPYSLKPLGQIRVSSK